MGDIDKELQEWMEKFAAAMADPEKRKAMKAWLKSEKERLENKYREDDHRNHHDYD